MSEVLTFACSFVQLAFDKIPSPVLEPANTAPANITAPPVYQAVQSPVPKLLYLYIIIGMIVAIIGFIIVRIIPEAGEAKNNADACGYPKCAASSFVYDDSGESDIDYVDIPRLFTV